MVDTSHLPFDWNRIERIAITVVEKYARNYDEFEDLLQECRIKAARIVESKTVCPVSYLWNTFHNVGKDHIRFNSRRPLTCSFEDAPMQDFVDGPIHITECFDDPSAVEEFERVESAIDLRQAIRGLPHIHKRVVSLMVTHQMSYEEMSDHLGIPVGTVRSRVHRARAAIERANATAGVS